MADKKIIRDPLVVPDEEFLSPEVLGIRENREPLFLERVEVRRRLDSRKKDASIPYG